MVAERMVAWLGTLLILAVSATARAGPVTYSEMDRATVHLLALRAIGTESLQHEGHRVEVAFAEATHGSGVLVSADGLILTARHVVEGARLLAVRVPGEETVRPARVIYESKRRDYAFVSIEGEYEHFAQLPERAPELAVRETVDAIGYPIDARRADPQSVRGVVSGVHPDGLLQLGMALNPGNSGGPVVNASEELVGIAISRYDPRRGAQGIGFALPIAKVLKTWRKLTGDRGRQEQARAELAAARAVDEAAVALMADVVRLDPTLGSFASAEEVGARRQRKRQAQLVKVVEDALAGPAGEHPEVMVLAAAVGYNLATQRILDRKGGHAQAMSHSSELVKAAVEADPALRERSKFVRWMLARKSRRSSVRRESSSARESTADTAERDYAESRFRGAKHPPPVMLAVGAGIHLPHQFIAARLSATATVPHVAALNASVAFGKSVEVDSGALSASAFIGYPVLAKVSQGSGRAVLESGMSPGVHWYKYNEVEVPVYSELLLEAGVSSGDLGFYVCDAGCAPDTYGVELTGGEQQTAFIFAPGAGLRYSSFYDARNLSRVRARNRWSLFAHVLFMPQGVPRGDLYAGDLSFSAGGPPPASAQPLSRGSMGIEVGAEFNPFLAYPFTSSVVLGLHPATGQLIFAFFGQVDFWAAQ